MPRIRVLTRILAGILGLGAAAGAVVAGGHHDWLSVFLLCDLAALCGYVLWKGRDPVAPSMG
jgi:hypothetical protein